MVVRNQTLKMSEATKPWLGVLEFPINTRYQSADYSVRKKASIILYLSNLLFIGYLRNERWVARSN